MFVDRLSTLLVETGTDCFAWSLMSNHFHLLLRPNQIELSSLMRRLLTGYAVNFNRSHCRVGHLFQNRYKSIVCEEEPYFLELIRYIHLNPLRAKLIPDLDALATYPWTGHAVLLANREFDGQSVDEVLLRFDKHLKVAREKYWQFVADGVPQGKRPELVGGGLRRSQKSSGEQGRVCFDDRILGSGDFVDELRQGIELRGRIPCVLPVAELATKVALIIGIDANLIRFRSRLPPVSEARAICCFLAVRNYGVSGMEVGCYLSMGASSVSRAVRRGEKILQKSPALETALNQALKQ